MAVHKACKDAGISTPPPSVLFKDFHSLQAICAHPAVLAMKKTRELANKIEKIDDDKCAISSDNDSSSVDNGDSDAEADQNC